MQTEYLILITSGLVEIIKAFKVKKKLLPFLACVIGLIFSYLAQYPSVYEMVLNGLLIGLSSVGLYEGVKNVGLYGFGKKVVKKLNPLSK